MTWRSGRGRGRAAVVPGERSRSSLLAVVGKWGLAEDNWSSVFRGSQGLAVLHGRANLQTSYKKQ